MSISEEEAAPVCESGFHDTIIRVRYAETDRMGIAYNAHYLTWFEVGRTEFLRAVGQTYRDTESNGYLLPLSSAEVHYLKPARYDDVLLIRTYLSERPGARLTIGYVILRDDEKIATGSTVHAFTDETLTPVKPPRDLRNELLKLWSLAQTHGKESRL